MKSYVWQNRKYHKKCYGKEVLGADPTAFLIQVLILNNYTENNSENFIFILSHLFRTRW
jgi:hypothetical protein